MKRDRGLVPKNHQ